MPPSLANKTPYRASCVKGHTLCGAIQLVPALSDFGGLELAYMQEGRSSQEKDEEDDAPFGECGDGFGGYD